MAKTKPKSSGYSIRRVNTKEDRRRPSVFMRLKTDESFKGIALFEPDPGLKDNPGYFEYYDHYDKQGNSYVPCAGDKCPFCAANDNPSTRALTVWYFADAADKKDQIKVFTMNYSTINDISDESEEEEGLVGKTVRIKRLSDKGDYKVRVVSAKPLTKKQLATAMNLLEEKFEDGLEGLVERQLAAQMERLKALDALDDDDDDEDDEEETPKARRGREIVDESDDDEDDDEDEEDEEDEDEEADEDEDEEDEEESDEDEDEEEESDEDEDDEDEDEEETEAEEEEILDGSYEVQVVNKNDEILTLKDKDGEKIKAWVGEGVNPDYDKAVKGALVKIKAEKDDEDDWIITALKVTRAAADKKAGKSSGKSDRKSTGRKSSGRSKGGRKK